MSRLHARRQVFTVGLIVALATSLVALTAPGAQASNSSGHTFKVLHHGANGHRVKQVQRVLDVKPVSGHFNDRTRHAVRKFQQRRSIAANGAVTERTWHALSSKWHRVQHRRIGHQREVPADHEGCPRPARRPLRLRCRRPRCVRLLWLHDVRVPERRWHQHAAPSRLRSSAVVTASHVIRRVLATWCSSTTVAAFTTQRSTRATASSGTHRTRDRGFTGNTSGPVASTTRGFSPACSFCAASLRLNNTEPWTVSGPGLSCASWWHCGGACVSDELGSVQSFRKLLETGRLVGGDGAGKGT